MHEDLGIQRDKTVKQSRKRNIRRPSRVSQPIGRMPPPRPLPEVALASPLLLLLLLLFFPPALEVLLEHLAVPFIRETEGN